MASVAIAAVASRRAVARPASSRSSTAMAQAALGGCLPLAGCRVAVTLMCTAFAGSGWAGGGGLSRLRRGPPFRMLAMPVAIQWPWNFAQALLWVEGLGCSREACSALSCSYWTRAATFFSG